MKQNKPLTEIKVSLEYHIENGKLDRMYENNDAYKKSIDQMETMLDFINNASFFVNEIFHTRVLPANRKNL